MIELLLYLPTHLNKEEHLKHCKQNQNSTCFTTQKHTIKLKTITKMNINVYLVYNII